MFKEVAKFAAGLTAWESFVHFSFATSGNLPINLWGFRITETINTVQIILPAICCLLLVYYAWFRKTDSWGN